MNFIGRADAALAQVAVTTFMALLEAVRPLCPHCDGDGGAMEGYYEPEWSECRCCNRDGQQNDIPGKVRIWRWSWWLFQYRDWREARRVNAWVDAEVARERDLRYGANPEHWQ